MNISMTLLEVACHEKPSVGDGPYRQNSLAASVPVLD